MAIRILSENYYNVFQFSGHVVTASTYTVGNEPWRVATGRRQGRSAWISPTTGTQWIRTTCDEVRAADMLALDRGHNVATVSVQFTNSTAAGWSTFKSITIPSGVSTPGTRLIDGVRTVEGAYIRRFATTTAMPVAKHWRLSCATTGAGAKVKVVGAYLGKSWSPSAEPIRPWDDETIQMQRSEIASPELWTTPSRVASRRVGTATVRLTDAEGQQARLFVQNRFWKGELAWITPNENSAETTVLAVAQSGVRGLSYTSNWPNRVLELDWVEHQPAPQ